jgi:hypothetical protein
MGSVRVVLRDSKFNCVVIEAVISTKVQEGVLYVYKKGGWVTAFPLSAVVQWIVDSE